MSKFFYYYKCYKNRTYNICSYNFKKNSYFLIKIISLFICGKVYLRQFKKNFEKI